MFTSRSSDTCTKKELEVAQKIGADMTLAGRPSRGGLLMERSIPYRCRWNGLLAGIVYEVLGQKGPWTRQNGPRFRTKRTTSKDKTDHVPGQNGPGFRTERTRILDKTGPILGQAGSCKKSHDVLQKSEESSQYP